MSIGMDLKNFFLLFVTILISTHNTRAAVLSTDDEYFYGYEADRLNWSAHPCRRSCLDRTKPRVCKYVFIVEKFSSMSKACYNCPFNTTDCFRPHCIPTDGIKKPVYVVNRQLPGPLIEVCQNDWVVVEVRNLMLSESVTIHWHGLKQKGTPYSDGVPFVTQCPILPGNRYQYYFNASSTGTFFWHSHIGNQKADGLFGPMVVNHVRSKDLYVDKYDYDIHRVVVNEWIHQPGDVNENRDNYAAFNATMETILINGLGPYVNFTTSNGTIVYTPATVIEVKPGKKYRIRLINAGSENCPLEGSIDNHMLLVIALDGKYIKPVEVDVVTSWSGERIDFIVNATQKSGNYWIRFRGLGRCSSSRAYQVAILRYLDADVQNPSSPIGYQYPITNNSTRILNPYDRGSESDSEMYISIPSLISMDKDDFHSAATVDQQIYIVFDAYTIDNYDFHRKNIYSYNNVTTIEQVYTVQLNHISLKLPPFPLLSQYKMITSKMLCNSSYIPFSANCTAEQCSCIHVINLKLNTVVELVFIDEGTVPINHPMHLHGHFFRVVASEKVNGKMTVERFKQMDRRNMIKRNLNHAPIKDTMKVPNGGYSVVRFLANNPGYWFFHCHFEPHNNMGMAFIFKIGEHKDFPKKPAGFPTCGSFITENLN